jgi:hypothetical protein
MWGDDDDFPAKDPEWVAWDLLGSSASALAHEQVTAILYRLVHWTSLLDKGSHLERAQAERLLDSISIHIRKLEDELEERQPGRRTGTGERRHDFLRLIVRYAQRMRVALPVAHEAIISEFAHEAAKIDARFEAMQHDLALNQLSRLYGSRPVTSPRVAGVLSVSVKAFGDNDDGKDPTAKRATNAFAQYADATTRLR